MASVDQRVVEMKFDNAAFERGVSTTMSTLDKLKNKLNFDGASKGLNGLSAAGKNVDLSGVSKGVDGISAKFSAMSVIGVTALATITNKAVNAGTQLIKSFTIAPLLDGFNQYEQQIKATGTIMANVAASGSTLKDVTATLDEMNVYANKTIYSFSDMATNLGTFTSAGIKLKPASEAIQGLSNVAAAAGAGTQQASSAMYQLSQALGRGKVTAQDWNSVVANGMASANFQNGLLETAKAMGTIQMPKTESIDQWIKKGGNFKDAMSKGSITSGVLITYLQAMAGKLSDAELKQKGFTDAQIKSIKVMQKNAEAAAVNVKTFTQLKDNLSQGVGSAWATVFKTIFGDINGATTLFTHLSVVLSAIFIDPILHLDEFLKKLKAMGALKNFGDGLKNIFTALGQIFHNIGHAFREIFPPSSGKTILAISKAFEAFTEHLKLGNDTAGNVMYTFKGLFSILKIALSIVGGVAKAFFGLFGILGTGGGGGISTILKFTAVAGEFITKIQEWLTKTGAIQAFFTVLTSPLKLLKPTVDILVKLAAAFSSLLVGDVSGFTAQIGGVGTAVKSMFTGVLSTYQTFAQTLSSGLAKIEAFFTGFADRAKNSGNSLVAGIAGAIAKVAGALSKFTGNVSISLSGLISGITGVTNEGKNFLAGFGSGTVNKVGGAVSGLGTTMQDLHEQMNFKPALAAFNTGFDGAASKASSGMSTFAKISSALGSFLASIGHGIASMASGLGTILAGLRDFFSTLIHKVTDYISNMNGNDAIAVFNTGVMVALYLTIKNFLGKFSGLLDTFKGIGAALKSGITNSFGQLTDTLKTMQQSVKADILLKIAGAVGILVAALWILTKIDPGKLAVALGALTALFVQLSSTMVVIAKFADGTSTAKMAALGFTLLALAAAILVLSIAVKIMSTMNWQEMLKGLLGIAALLAGLALFTKFATLDKGGVKTGAGLILMAVAINLLAVAVKVIGSMNTGNIVKAALAIDYLLGSLTFAAKGMEGTLKGSAAMLIMATALGVLTPVLVTLGLLPYENLAKGLGTVAIALGLLAIAANAMDGALPGATAMIAVAGAIAILTPALLAFGLMSVSSIAKSLIVLAGALTILVIATNAMDTALPGAAALLIVAGALAVLTPVLVVLGQLSWGAIVKGITALALVLAVLIAAVYALTPVIAIMILATKSIALLGAAVLLAGLGFLAFSAGLTALAVTGAAGFAVLVAGVVSFLAILPLIGRQVGYAFVTFATVIAQSAPTIVGAFTAIVMAMLKSLQTTVPEFIRTMGIILKSMLDEIVRRAPQIYAAGLDVIIGFLKALRSRIAEITNLVIDIFTIFLTTVRNRLPNIIRAGIDLIVAFLNGLAQGIRDRQAEIGAAGRNIASALIEGTVNGIKGLGNLAVEAIKNLARGIINAFMGFFGIHSPSTVFAGLGLNLIQGLANGIAGAAHLAGDAIRNLATGVFNAGKAAFNVMGAVGSYIVDGLVNGITGGYHKVIDAAKALANHLPTWARKVLGIASPSKEFIKIGEFINDGLVVGLTGGSRDKVTAAMEETAKLLTDTITSANDDIEKSTTKLNNLTDAQAKNTAARNIAQKEYAADVAALKRMTAAQKEDEAARIATAAEIVRDKQRIQELTSARHVDTAAVKAAQTELAKDEARYRSLRDARQGEIDAIKAKGLEIDKDKERLRTLTLAEGDNKAAIEATKAAIIEATAERDRATAASQVVQTQLSAETDQLNTLADAYQNISDQLDTANKALEDAIKVRDDYKKSVTDKYSDLPDINKDTTLTDYLSTLQKKVDDTNAFSAAVQKLRDLGLNDATYKDLVEKGVDALPFVNALLAGGASAVEQVNLISANLLAASATLGQQASSALYDAGVHTAQGLVDGLHSQLEAVKSAMAELAAAMQAKINAELKIKSPSRVMAQVGVYTVQGLVNGLNNSVPLVEGAAGNLGSAAASAMREAMLRVSDAVDTNLDLVPTITPVLDLSDIQKGAAKIGGMMTATPVTVGSSYSRAAEASQMYRSNREAELASVGATSTDTPAQITFIQNNNSPKALSQADIYRRTNNQLSVAKGALTRNAN